MSDTLYKVGFIYKLYSHINEHYYLGSTTSTLRQRKSWHLKRQKVSKKVADWIDDVGAENIKIEELHKYEDLTARQLKMHEDNVIKEHLGKEHCLNCNRAYRTKKEYYQDNKDVILEKKKQYGKDNKDKIKQYREDNKEIIADRQKIYRELNLEKIKKQQKQYRQDNLEFCRKRDRNYYWKNVEHNRARKNANGAKRHSKKLKSCPEWLSQEDLSKIKSIYKMARNISKKTGIQHQVDHIIPLQGETVCGLHVPWNLRVITKEENLSKSNKLIEDMVCPL